MSILDIKKAVRERDGYRCTQCAMTLQEHVAKYGWGLEVHRLKPGEPYSVEGCVTLCRGCHVSKPKRYYGFRPKEPATLHLHFPAVIADRVTHAARRLSIASAAYIRMVVTQRMDEDGVPDAAPRPKKKP